MDAPYCIGRAEECEARAQELHDPTLKRQWLDMADDWRMAAAVPSSSANDDNLDRLASNHDALLT